MGLFGFVKKFKSNKNNESPRLNIDIKTEVEQDWNDFALRAHQAEKIREKYKNIIDLHNEYIGKYEKMYSVLLNSNLLKTENAEGLIKLILADIEIAPEWKAMDYEISKVYETEPIRYYPAFTRLALVYEKREEYAKAIEICQRAIELGYDNDKTKGGMQGRIARLCKKAGLNPLDYIDISDI